MKVAFTSEDFECIRSGPLLSCLKNLAPPCQVKPGINHNRLDPLLPATKSTFMETLASYDEEMGKF